jgi:hypothetical protein
MKNGDAPPADLSATEPTGASKSGPVGPGPFAGGVTLLLKGNDRNVGVPSPAFPSDPVGGPVADLAGIPNPSGRSSPPVPAAHTVHTGWIPQALVFSDLVMVAVAVLWAVAGEGDWRWIGIGALMVVGCVQALVAWTLVRPADTGNALNRGASEPAAAPRIRVHFVDETPRHRR